MGYGLAGTRAQPTCFPRMIQVNGNAGSRISCPAAPAMPPPFASSAPNCSRFGLIWIPERRPSKLEREAGGPAVVISDSVFTFVTCEPAIDHCTIAETGRAYEQSNQNYPEP